MLPKGVNNEIIYKCEKIFLDMFNDKKIKDMMDKSGSPMYILNRQQTIKLLNNVKKNINNLLINIKN